MSISSAANLVVPFALSIAAIGCSSGDSGPRRGTFGRTASALTCTVDDDCTGTDSCCSGGCVNQATDPKNCGACGIVCGTGGGTCVDGACNCPVAAPTQCGTACVDTDTDAKNCGACGTTCPGYQTCGGGVCSCGGARYTILEPAVPACTNNGSGRVEDNTTSLIWMINPYYYAPTSEPQTWTKATAYCASQGMRLPTKDEALGIAGVNWDRCVWPCGWATWTSSLVGSSMVWGAYSTGAAYTFALSDNGRALCVR